MEKTTVIAAAALACLSVKAADLTVQSGTTHAVDSDEQYGTVTLEGAAVSLDAAQLKCQTVAATASSTIKFNGGKLGASSWDVSWFNPSAGATLTLESVNGHDIYLDVGYQRHYFSQGDGTVATAGAGDMVVRSDKSGADRMYLTFRNNNVTWGHSGDLRATGSGGLRLWYPGKLPFGASTGGVKLEDSTELLLGGNAASDVNTVEGSVRADGTPEAPSTLRFGKYKDGAFRNAPNVGGVCNVEKHGSGTSLTLDNTRFHTLDVIGGTVMVSGGATTVCELNMRAGSTLNVSDTTFAATNASAFTDSSRVVVGTAGVFDAVGGTDASLVLESTGTLIKRGAGTWNVYGDNALTGRVHVAGGTMKLRYREWENCASDQWWRVSITKQAYKTKGVTLAEIGLFAGSERVNGGLSATTAEESSMPNGTAKITSSSFSSGLVANLFDSNGSTIWGPNWQDPASSAQMIDGTHPLTIVMRLPSAHVGKVVTAADLSNNPYFNDHAKSFTVESSSDGVNWTARGSYNDLSKADWSNWYGGSAHFAVPEAMRGHEGTGNGGRGLSRDTVVRVDGGATLDMSLVKPSELVVSTLEIDCTAGNGTITDLAFAESGTIDKSGPVPESAILPLAITRPVNPGDARRWKVRLDGSPKNGMSVICDSGVLRLVPTGTVILFK